MIYRWIGECLLIKRVVDHACGPGGFLTVISNQLAICFRYAKSSHSWFARQHIHKLIPVYHCGFVTIVETCICRVSDAITS